MNNIERASNILEEILDDEEISICSTAGELISEALGLLRQAVTGKIERGEGEPIVAIPHIPATDNQKHQAYLDYVNNFLTTHLFALHYGLTESNAKKLIEEGRKIHEASVAANCFTVIAVSENTNSFGLKSIILLNESGEAWEILKSAYGSEELPKQGDTIKRAGGVFAIGCECPRRLKDTSPAVARKVIADATKK